MAVNSMRRDGHDIQSSMAACPTSRRLDALGWAADERSERNNTFSALPNPNVTKAMLRERSSRRPLPNFMARPMRMMKNKKSAIVPLFDQPTSECRSSIGSPSPTPPTDPYPASLYINRRLRFVSVCFKVSTGGMACGHFLYLERMIE